MSNKDREYEEFLRLFEKEHPTKLDTSTQKQEQKRSPANHSMSQRIPYSQKTVPPLKQSVERNRTSQKSVHSRKRQVARKRRQRIIACSSVLTLIFLITVIAMICKSCSGNKDNLAVLQGVWHYDLYTEYEFDGKGNGCMCIEETNHYEFTYTIDGDILKIDYALDYVTDCEYDFKLENNKLTLIGGKGTATPGQEYILERVR